MGICSLRPKVHRSTVLYTILRARIRLQPAKCLVLRLSREQSYSSCVNSRYRLSKSSNSETPPRSSYYVPVSPSSFHAGMWGSMLNQYQRWCSHRFPEATALVQPDPPFQSGARHNLPSFSRQLSSKRSRVHHRALSWNTQHSASCCSSRAERSSYSQRMA